MVKVIVPVRSTITMVIGAMLTVLLVMMGSSFLSPIVYTQAQPSTTNSSVLMPVPPEEHPFDATQFSSLLSKLTVNQNNFTKVLSDVPFVKCYPQQSGATGCLPMVYIRYQSPTMLVFDSTYTFPVWMAADLAQKVGYKVSAVSVYTTHSQFGDDTNTEIVMSK